MEDWSQDSAHPSGGATSDERVSDHDSVTTESRWSELYRLLLASGTVAYALAPTGRMNEPVKVGSGDAGRLMAEAEHAGAGRAVWAVVAPLRPDLLVADLDECADILWPVIRDTAEDVGAAVAHLATSGRPNCLHVALACPTPLARAELTAVIARTFEFHRPALPSSAAADIRGRKPLRLPGSCSLKGLDPCVVIDTDTMLPITAVAAAFRATQALRVLPSPTDQTNPSGGFASEVGADDLIDSTASTTLQYESPRAWRARKRLTGDDWRILNDSTRTDRSLAATEGAWRLWRHGVRSFAAARWWYERLPCFAKFRDRDLQAHRQRGARGPMRWEHCARHWASIVRRARTHKPTVPAEDQTVIDAVLAEVSHWDEPELSATVAVLIAERFASGHGIHARPIARRDLNMWMHFSDGTAARVLQELRRRDVLELVEQWPAVNPRHANLYTLKVPSAIYRGKGAHDVTSPTAKRYLTSPLWAHIGHLPRTVWTQLATHTHGLSSSHLATSLGIPQGDRTYGVVRALRTLASLGLAVRTGRGRTTRWQAAPDITPELAATSSGATERARQIHARVVAERRCWHSETRREQARSKRGLVALRARLTHADANASGPGVLELVGNRGTTGSQRYLSWRVRRPNGP